MLNPFKEKNEVNESHTITHKLINVLHISLLFVLNILFLFFNVLMFHYFQFIRLLNASNYFIMTFQFNELIHELTSLIKDAS